MSLKFRRQQHTSLVNYPKDQVSGSNSLPGCPKTPIQITQCFGKRTTQRTYLFGKVSGQPGQDNFRRSQARINQANCHGSSVKIDVIQRPSAVLVFVTDYIHVRCGGLEFGQSSTARGSQTTHGYGAHGGPSLDGATTKPSQGITKHQLLRNEKKEAEASLP